MPPRPLSSADADVWSVEMAAQASGDAVVAWRQVRSSRQAVCASRFRAASGAWVEPHCWDAADPSSAVGPQVAVDAPGHAAVAWADGRHIVASRFDAAEGRWSETTSFAHEGESAQQLRLSIGPDGALLLAWQRRSAGRDGVSIARLAWDDAAHPAVGVVRHVDVAAPPLIATGPSQDLIAVWPAGDEAPSRPLAIGREPGGAGSGARIALDAEGAAIAVWTGRDAIRANTSCVSRRGCREALSGPARSPRW